MILAAGEVTGFLSVNLTTIIATLLNTLILFLVLKHFLFDKVNKVIKDRQDEVADTYKKADEANENARKLEAQYSEKLNNAKAESADIIREATKKAQMRSDEIITDARNEAKGLIDNASAEIEKQKKIAVNQVKDQITDIAFAAASAVVEKDMSGEDNEKLIEKFIDNVGEV